jgi:MFS family permease
MLRSLSSALRALREVVANPDIRRAQLAWMLGYAADWAWLVALFVYAFDVGGVASVGLIGVVRTIPAAVLAPVMSTLTDRLPRHRVLLGIYAGRAALVGLAAAAVAGGLPAWVVFVLAPVDGLLAVMHRPTYMALLPSLARSPEELVASNAASATMEGIGTLIGPAVGGALVAAASPAVTFGIPAGIFMAAAGAVVAIRPAQRLRTTIAGRNGWSRLVGGLAALGQQRHAALILAMFGAQILVRGILNVLLVAASVQLLGLAEQGVGLLNAAIGAGGLIGALAAMTLVTRPRLAPFMALGLVLWGTPILVIGLVPVAAVAVAVLVVLGAGNAVLDVSGFSLLQRTVPNAVRGQVFGVLEALVMLGLGAGSALAPLLVAAFGVGGALVATGLLLPAVAIVSWPGVRRADSRAVIPARELELLRRVPMFRLLPLTVLEQVADAAVEERFAAGSQLIVQGATGDSFYILADGAARVSVDGRPVREFAPGDSFGEIALLRDVPRTASITAESDGSAFVISREAFLCAVTGDRQSLAAANAVITERTAVAS